MKARDILNAKGRTVVTVPPGTPLADAISLLAARNIGAVVIAQEDEPLGILSERDVVRALAGAPTGFRGTQVDSLMTTALHTATLEAGVDELLDLMTERRVRHVPVLEEGKLVGILSIGDVVKHRMREVVDEREALRSYISG
ncbi:CBS domain-containing protein [Parvularcula dongshanensis]|uniref:CBS domain-containing protein n=1 Tax=Parvularcula dongshanensis TaxID=1173995 RepID=A0A840I2G8_9PROT|nr:CBS domain-containing protein [Parvularcula dongshanensis]MBB4659029.1 CBS domain-containing protein [Parvularcula dongshanensis]